MNHLERIAEELIKGDEEAVAAAARAAIEAELPAQTILNDGLIAGMNVIGERFRNHEVFLPEVLVAARAMLAAMEVLEPHLANTGVEPKGKVTLGTVKGDIHNIGKNLVGVMLKGAGFEVTDLGIDVPPERFIEAARDGAPIIGMSALTSTTIPAIKTSIDALHAAGADGS